MAKGERTRKVKRLRDRAPCFYLSTRRIQSRQWEMSSSGRESSNPNLVLLEQGQSGSRSASELVEVGGLAKGAVGGDTSGTDTLAHRGELLGLFSLGCGLDRLLSSVQLD